MEDAMTTIRTYGRRPTLGEMKEYYAREEVLDFLYDECQARNIQLAFRRKRWSINPTSKAHLREIIDDTIRNKIETAYSGIETEFFRKNSVSDFDNIRLEECDYLSLHSASVIKTEDKTIGFDLVYEADQSGWRASFEALSGMIKLLNDFDICYRIKYSGVRSLHLLIPFEALPKEFNGKPLFVQREGMVKRIVAYFRRNCGARGSGHSPPVLRLAYSLNEDNGLVSVPIVPDELISFRPWKAHIYNVVVNQPWHTDVPAAAWRKTARFLQEVYADAKRRRKRTKVHYCGIDITSITDKSAYEKRDAFSVEAWTQQLKSKDESVRLEAAWNLLASEEPLPLEVLEEGLSDGNPDVRWYLTEALQKRPDANSLKLAEQMLLDSDDFVRISASDILVLAGESILHNLWDIAISGTKRSASGYIAQIAERICEGDMEKVRRSFVEYEGPRKIAVTLQNSIDNEQQIGWMRGYIRMLIGVLRGGLDIELDTIFSEVLQSVVPELLRNFRDESETTLQAVRENRNAMALLNIVREISDRLSRCTVEVLVKTGDSAVIPILVEALGEKMGFLNAISGLVQIGKPAIPFLLEAIRENKPRLSSNAADALGKIGSSDIVPALLEVLKDEQTNETIRASVVKTLRQLGSSDAVPALIEVLKDEQAGETTRINVVEALSEFGAPTAVPVLLEALKKESAMILRHVQKNKTALQNILETLEADGEQAEKIIAPLEKQLLGNSPWLHRRAAEVLKKTGTPEAQKVLDEYNRTAQNASFLQNVVDALGEIGEPSRGIATALTELLKDDMPWMRRHITSALEKVSAGSDMDTWEENRP